MAQTTLTKIALLVMLPFALTFTSLQAATTIATDSFESGELKQTTPEGFKWTDSTYTSVTTTNTSSSASSSNSISLTNNLANDKGSHALKFNYRALKNWSEQRFTLGNAYPDLWISYWLYIPTNFYHRTVKPTNNKLFAIWMDEYSSKGMGPTVVWETWADGSGGSIVSVHYSPGNLKPGGAHTAHTQLLTAQVDQGQWIQIALHVKAATGAGTKDGVIQLYKRRKSENTMMKLQEVTNADISIPSSGPIGWKSGYFMGWSNPGFDKDTYFLIDNVEFLTTPPPPIPPHVLGSKPKEPATSK